METKLASRSALWTIARLHRLILCVLLFNISEINAQIIVPYRSSWKYAPESSTAPASTWKTSGFNDASWKTGNGAFAFGNFTNNTFTTTLQRRPSETSDNYPVFYFRKTFDVANVANYSNLRLRATLDDGVVIYINGVEVARKNMTPLSQSGYAGTIVGTPLLSIDTVLSTSVIQNGTNLIAVELHQTGATSSDIFFDMQLEGPYLFRYPYLQLASYNQMTVCWYTNLPTTATVRYSTNSNLANYTEVSSATNDTLHSVKLKNLNADTKYYYSVGYYKGNTYWLLQNKPSVNYFRTLPSPTDTSHSLRFWLLGDSGASTPDNPRPIKVRDAYLNYLSARNNPDVNGIVFLGDNSNTFPYEGLQPALDLTLFKFYNLSTDQQLLSHIPSWTVIGNHDYDPEPNYVHSDGKTYYVRKAYHKLTAASFSTFAYPDSAQIGGEPTYNKKGYYSFNQGDIHFVVLNPPLIEVQNINHNWVKPYRGSTVNFDIFSKNSIALDDSLNTSIDSLPQVKWLVKDLKSNTKKWTVVTFHLPPFSTIGHFPSEYDMKRVQDKLLPILEKPEYHVDAVIVSHSHAYLRAGMIRKNGAQARTTDFSQSGNLGRYPASLPYIKKNTETAYAYILSGSAGRGYNKNGIDDSGYDDTNPDEVQHPSKSNPPLDNLTGNTTTKFYHEDGGSVELVFQETRLDVKFIKESDESPRYVIADSFVVMKDVNKKTTVTVQNGGDAVTLKASWIGNYNWYSSADPNTEIPSGIRELTFGPTSSGTYYVRDDNRYLADTFIVNVVHETPNPGVETLIPYRSEWLFPLSAGFTTKGVKMNEQCILPLVYSAPAYEWPIATIIGLGHNDERYKLPNSSIERVFVPAERLWFRRGFTLDGSVSTYANFKLTLLMDRNLSTRKSYTTKVQTIMINGNEVQATSSTTLDLGNGREEVTYTLSNRGFVTGTNYILVSFYLTPLIPVVFPMNASTDPFTFDAQLISTPLALAPPPPSKQLQLTKATLASQQVCTGDTVSVQFTTSGNESGFPIVYEAQLVTASGDIPLAEGNQSPILVRLPANLLEGDYKIKVVTKSPYMDRLESSAMKVKVLPKAAITPNPTISVWKGELFSIPVKFEGGGPWNYVLSDSSKGTSAPTATAIQVKASRTGTYTISSVSNSCGVGQATGSVQVEVKEPILSVGKVVGFTSAPLKTALCDGDSISVAYSIVGPNNQRTYAIELSDQNGSFGTPVVLGNGTTNPLRVMLPTSISEGDKYRIRVKALNPDVDFTLGNSDAMTIRKMAAGNFTVSKEAIYNNEEIKLNVALTGTPPVYYYLRYGTDTLYGNVSQPMLDRTIALHQTTVFSLDSVRNVCGYGLVSGNRTVTVNLLVGLDPLSAHGITAYPNPTSELILLKSNRLWKGSLRWRIYHTNGKVMQRGTRKSLANVPFEINIGSLPAGLYILGLTEGDEESTWKIIKK